MDQLRALFELFGTTQAAGRSRVYEVLSAEIVGDEEILGLMLGTAPVQRKPSLLFACVNALLAEHPDESLAAYYPTHGGRREVDDGLMPAFREFCRTYRDPLAALLQSRSTQTNEPRRAIALKLAVSHLVREWDCPVAVAEVGASAGLNLSFDRYSFSTRFLGGEPEAPPNLRVTNRLGIDAQPVDLRDPVARAWLAAFVWPEQVDDLEMLRQATEVTLAGDVSVVAGDAARDVERLLSAVPGDEPLVVFTASLLSYLTPGDRAAYLEQLDAVGQHRTVAWVFAEAPGLLARAGLDVPPDLARRNSTYLVGTGGDLLALADPYVRWLAPRRTPDDDFAWVP
ncbi:DUF2332 domain-containing protein [Kribbella sp. WER1]